MSTALIICIVGGIIHLCTWLMKDDTPKAQIATLSKWAFAIGLLAFLLK